MYAHLDGILSEKTADGLVIDCGGVGYFLTVTSSALSSAPKPGERMKLYTYLSVREDAMELFGFVSREEKRMFEKLRSVGGIGSKTALQILSSLRVSELSLALVSGDTAALSRVPGIGKKTAQRLILELRDKVEDGELTGSSAPIARAMGGSATGEAIEALMALGYQSSEAARAISAISPMPEKVDEIVYLALKGMGK